MSHGESIKCGVGVPIHVIVKSGRSCVDQPKVGTMGWPSGLTIE